MTKQKYSEDFKVRTYDCDFTREISPIAILSYLAEVATTHAKELGLGYQESWDKGFYWILRSTKYELFRVPSLFDTVKVYTWPVGMHGLKSLRRFSMYIEDELIGEGYHYWIMMDHRKQKPIISDYFLEKVNDTELLKKDFFKLDKIRTPEGMEFSYTVTIRPKDIDWNMHVNNVRYSDIVYNAIPFNILKDNQIISFQIDYLKECKLNDVLNVYYKNDNNTIYIDGKKENISMFKTKIEIK